MLCLTHLRFDYILPNQRQILQSCQAASEQSIYCCQVWQVWGGSTRLVPEQETWKLCFSKAGAGSHNWFVLGQSMWWVCPGATDPGRSWLWCSYFWNKLSDNWKITKVLWLENLRSGAEGFTEASGLRAWEPQCSKPLRGSGDLSETASSMQQSQDPEALMTFSILPFTLICMVRHPEDA